MFIVMYSSPMFDADPIEFDYSYSIKLARELVSFKDVKGLEGLQRKSGDTYLEVDEAKLLDTLNKLGLSTQEYLPDPTQPSPEQPELPGLPELSRKQSPQPYRRASLAPPGDVLDLSDNAIPFDAWGLLVQKHSQQ